MKVTRGRVAAIIAERSLGSISARRLGQEVAAYLLDEGRTSELDSIMRDIRQYRADHGIVEVIAVSAIWHADENDRGLAVSRNERAGVERDAVQVVAQLLQFCRRLQRRFEHFLKRQCAGPQPSRITIAWT